MRNKSLVRALKTWIGKRVPQYVFKETICTHLWYIAHIVKREWSLEVLNLGLDDLDQDSQRKILEREFGDVEYEYAVEDRARMEKAREIASLELPGTNEPIILLEESSGFELHEGWHRAMARLPRDGSRIPIRAWIGRKKKNDEP